MMIDGVAYAVKWMLLPSCFSFERWVVRFVVADKNNLDYYVVDENNTLIFTGAN